MKDFQIDSRSGKENFPEEQGIYQYYLKIFWVAWYKMPESRAWKLLLGVFEGILRKRYPNYDGILSNEIQHSGWTYLIIYMVIEVCIQHERTSDSESSSGDRPDRVPDRVSYLGSDRLLHLLTYPR